MPERNGMSTLEKLTITGLVIHSAAIWWIIFYESAFQVLGFVFATLPLVIAALVFIRKAWAIGVVAIASVLMAVMGALSPVEIARLTQSANLVEVGTGVLDVLGLVVASVAAILATISMYRRARSNVKETRYVNP
jgi:hypothetical protein